MRNAPGRMAFFARTLFKALSQCLRPQNMEFLMISTRGGIWSLSLNLVLLKSASTAPQ